MELPGTVVVGVTVRFQGVGFLCFRRRAAEGTGNF